MNYKPENGFENEYKYMIGDTIEGIDSAKDVRRGFIFHCDIMFIKRKKIVNDTFSETETTTTYYNNYELITGKSKRNGDVKEDVSNSCRMVLIETILNWREKQMFTLNDWKTMGYGVLDIKMEL